MQNGEGSRGEDSPRLLMSFEGARVTMKAHTEYLTLNIPSKMAFENITPRAEEAVRKRGWCW